MGNPRVKKFEPVPAPINTVPIRVWVQANLKNIQVYFTVNQWFYNGVAKAMGLHNDSMKKATKKAHIRAHERKLHNTS